MSYDIYTLRNPDKEWSDISAGFNKAWNKDVASVTGISSLNNALAGIIMTRKGSRAFDPDFGCDLQNSLFELMNPLIADQLKKDIITSIARYEPRVDIKRTYISVDPKYDTNEISITVMYALTSAADNSDYDRYSYSHIINQENYTNA